MPELIRDFSHLSIFIGAARRDPLIPLGQPEEVAALFESGGADVTTSRHQGGRELGEEDIQAAKLGSLTKRFGEESPLRLADTLRHD